MDDSTAAAYLRRIGLSPPVTTAYRDHFGVALDRVPGVPAG